MLVNVLTEDPHHLSDPESISLETEENIKVDNSLEIYIVKKYNKI